MPVENRQQQRAHLFRITQVEVGAGLRQGLRAVGASFAGCVQKGGEPTGGPVDRARLRGDLPLPVVDGRPGVDVGARGDEGAHHGRLILGGRPHQRRLTAPLFHRVDLGAPAQQRLGGVDATGTRDDHQRRLTVGVGRLDVAAGLEQRLDHVRAGRDRGLRHGRSAVSRSGVHLRAGSNQPGRELEIVLMRRPVQRVVPSASGAFTSARSSIRAIAAALFPDLTASTSGAALTRRMARTVVTITNSQFPIPNS